MSIAATNECLSESSSGPAANSHAQCAPLRVCMIAYSFYETDSRVMRYAETLAQRGDHVEVWALQRDDLPREEILDGVHLFRLQRREVNEKGRLSYLARIVPLLWSEQRFTR